MTFDTEAASQVFRFRNTDPNILGKLGTTYLQENKSYFKRVSFGFSRFRDVWGGFPKALLVQCVAVWWVGLLQIAAI